LIKYLPFVRSGISSNDKRSNNPAASSASKRGNNFELSHRNKKNAFGGGVGRLHSNEDGESQRSIVKDASAGEVWKTSRFEVSYSHDRKPDEMDGGTNGDSD
jgi:hypothetical protein